MRNSKEILELFSEFYPMILVVWIEFTPVPIFKYCAFHYNGSVSEALSPFRSISTVVAVAVAASVAIPIQ